MLDRGHTLCVVFAIEDRQILQEIATFTPEIILCPYLHFFLKSEIYENYPTFIFHPGPKGDRGAYSLENALQHQEWGVSILEASALYDGGDIYIERSFKVRDTYKASLYRDEVKEAYLSGIDEFLINYGSAFKIPQSLRPLHKKPLIKINWNNESSLEIIHKINLLDSYPGVEDEIMGVECHLFGAWLEEKLAGKPKEIVAKRDGAICLGTIDGAIWISHLKAKNSFKLPATYVLKEKLSGVKESRLPLLFDKSYATFYEISVEKRENVAYLCFNFHNGAMSAQQCIRLKYAIEYLKEECEVLVLVGGLDFFSNGIHLNILEDSKKNGEDGWSNINAMNDLIGSILEADEIITVASLAKNAGAGGLFLALACDRVVAHESVTLNPHYKTIGLSGSEYHTYTLPKRVGESVAEELLNTMLPLSSQRALKLGMVDRVFQKESYYEKLHSFAKESYSQEKIWEKQDILELEREKMQLCKKREIERMYLEFWEPASEFHTLRKNFVYKNCPTKTPQHLKEGKKYA
ncbi:enoyl-CoA hydratase-related protein [Sulfurimonas sp.]|uniref:enoyl-CoA hydratase-related protein n=1 Tax=Sulfurimonas sp. TaxID=2022749 RepID=UPI002635A931|nr:enoyl-CoA hydratase-related protein [Sulfurimonas sp.]